MKVAANKVVKLTYQLQVSESNEHWQVLEIVDANEPMVFIQGLSGLPEAFENQINGLSAGDDFNFSISAEDGYGLPDEEAIIDFPIDNFKIENGNVPEGMLEIGNIIPFTNDEHHRMNGRIIAIEDETVLLDFNHPLAGQNMHFEGKIIDIREATPDEIAHQHVHGEGGVHH